VREKMPLNLTEEHYKTADRDIREAYEAYVGVKAGDTLPKRRSFDEHVEWLARELKFSTLLGGGREGMHGLTSRDMAMWYIGSQWHVKVIRKLEQEEECVQQAVLALMEALPSPPCIGPMRTDRRNSKKKKSKPPNVAKSAAVEQEKRRAHIEHVLRIEAREEDEVLVARLVEEKKRQQVAKERADRLAVAKPFTPSGPSHKPAKEKPQPPPMDSVQLSKRQVAKDASLRLLSETHKESKRIMEMEAVHVALREVALETADAILYEE